jgi:hypothetical protein
MAGLNKASADDLPGMSKTRDYDQRHARSPSRSPATGPRRPRQ